LLLILSELPNQIGGAPIYSRYRGYGWGLQYDGDHPAAEASASAPAATSTIAAIDATDYRSSGTPPAEQFARRMGEREVLKAYAGFSCCADDGRLTAVATGNWGSGAFHGALPAAYPCTDHDFWCSV